MGVMRLMRSTVVAVLCLTAFPACVPAQERSTTSSSGVAAARADTTTLAIPAPTGFVDDFAHVLSADDVAALDKVAREVRARSHGEIAIVTLPSLDGQPIRDVATRIVNEWGVGYKGAPGDPATNTGVVILLAPNDRKVWIGTADGARAFLPDSSATSIARLMTPDFKAGHYGAGLRLGVAAVARAFARRFHFTLTTADSTASITP